MFKRIVKPKINHLDINKPKVYSGTELLDNEIFEMPTLLEPIFPKVGLIALAGSSDTGKSAFLRQFAIHISCGHESFLGFKIKAKHHSSIILSSEDDELAISYLLNKQNRQLTIPNKDFNRLRYIFDTSNPVETLDSELSNNPADAVAIDAFTDLYGGELNQSNKVRSFLNDFGNLAKNHSCLFIFLHHTGKGKDKLEPSKHNLLGSQGFEAKMRLVMELRKDIYEPDIRHLCVLKGNYLPEEYKNHSYKLKFNEHMLFHNLYQRVPFEDLVKFESNDRSIKKEQNIKMAKELKDKGFNQNQIALELGVDKATVSRYMK